LRAAGLDAEPERRQHAPFGNVEPVTFLISLDRAALTSREAIQPERNEPEQVEFRQNRSNLS